MKKTILLLFAMTLSSYLFANNLGDDGIYYQITSEEQSTAEVIACNRDLTGSIHISSSITFNGKIYCVNAIDSAAFHYCSGLTAISIPNSVTNIGAEAFIGCSGLTSIAIPSAVTSICNGTFAGCLGLTSITIPSAVNSIGNGAFVNCSGLTSISIPNSVTSIGTSAFAGCSGLTSIAIPSAVTSIGGAAFRDCSGLTSISIPNSLNSIGEYAFSNCSGLTSISMPNSVTSIGEMAFAGCSGLTAIPIPSSVTTISSGAFSNCDGLVSITIPDYITKIGDYAFEECTGLTSISIPNSVDSIGHSAFYHCPGLHSVYVAASVKTDSDNSVFGYSENITSMTAPAPFFDNLESSALKRIKVNKGIFHDSGIGCLNTSFRSFNAIDLTDAENTEIADGSFYNYYNMDTLLLPKALTVVPYEFAADCILLKSLFIPASVTELRMRSFENCRSLKTVEFEENSQLKKIDNWAFYACHALENIHIPEGVETIGDGAFWGCNYIKNIELPTTITSIGDNGFEGCVALTTLRSAAAIPPTVEGNTFFDIDKTIPVHVPVGTLNSYKAAPGWSDFQNIQADLPNSLSTSKKEAFIIHTEGKKIIIENATSEAISAFDVLGRKIFETKNAEPKETFMAINSGVQLIKIGSKTAKVIVE